MKSFFEQICDVYDLAPEVREVVKESLKEVLPLVDKNKTLLEELRTLALNFYRHRLDIDS